MAVPSVTGKFDDIISSELGSTDGELEIDYSVSVAENQNAVAL
jgi:hypothetical protein